MTHPSRQGASLSEPLTGTAPIKLYVCSSNGGKLRDFALCAQTFHGGDVAVEPLPALSNIPPPEENGTTFEENAVAKAIYYSGFSRELVVADDSGLEVAALAGAPGIRSARYAGLGATDEANNDLLLSRLGEGSRRDARFICVLAVAHQGRALLTAAGGVDGKILAAPQGNGGFGYDPLFFYVPLQRSFAELTPEEKLSVSHRGVALRQLFQQLREIVRA